MNVIFSSCGEDMEASDGELEDETIRPAKVIHLQLFF